MWGGQRKREGETCSQEKNLFEMDGCLWVKKVNPHSGRSHRGGK
jgi:hypothetical protein